MKSKLLFVVLLVIIQNTAFSERKLFELESLLSFEHLNGLSESACYKPTGFANPYAADKAQKSENSERIFEALRMFISAGYCPSSKDDFAVLHIIENGAADKAIPLIEAGFKNLWAIERATESTNFEKVSKMLMEFVRAGYRPSNKSDFAALEIAEKQLGEKALQMFHAGEKNWWTILDRVREAAGSK